MAVLFSGVAMAQETVVECKEDGFAVIKDGNGTLRTVYSPTPHFVLQAIRERKAGVHDARIVFKQEAERRSDAEMNAFADELVRLVQETPSRKVASDAIYALGSYERGLEVLIDIYENLDGTEAVSNRGMLRRIFHMPGGGEDYVMILYASLERSAEPCKLRPDTKPMVDGKRIEPLVPPKEEQCPYNTGWCAVATVLVGLEVADPADVYPICDKRWIFEDGRWSRIAGS
ncbi:MAG: hypothetical protein F4Y90_01300 [Rhodothermaceae bacterium]|nr:hypothetical protein [Rhodothermaceae bacterium]MYF40086.1 hypothetical protein [Rhodothermaceae bacterium]